MKLQWREHKEQYPLKGVSRNIKQLNGLIINRIEELFYKYSKSKVGKERKKSCIKPFTDLCRASINNNIASDKRNNKFYQIS